jgi:hypothetical protein
MKGIEHRTTNARNHAPIDFVGRLNRSRRIEAHGGWLVT